MRVLAIYALSSLRWFRNLLSRSFRRSLRMTTRRIVLFKSAADPICSQPRVLVVFHVYYHELVDEILEFLRSIPGDCSLIVTASSELESLERKVRQVFPSATVLEVSNVGRDIWPFIAAMRSIVLSDFDLICKVHTKKSPHAAAGDLWRKSLLSAMLGSPERVKEIFRLFASSGRVGMIGCEQYVSDGVSANKVHFDTLCRKLDCKLPDLAFVSGTMFWVRADLMREIRDADWIAETMFSSFGPMVKDGHVEHAFERLFGNLVRSRGFFVIGLSPFVRHEYVASDAVSALPVVDFCQWIGGPRFEEDAGEGPYAFLYRWIDGTVGGFDFVQFLAVRQPRRPSFCLCLSVDASSLRRPVTHLMQLLFIWDHCQYISFRGRPVLAYACQSGAWRPIILFSFWRLILFCMRRPFPLIVRATGNGSVFPYPKIRVRSAAVAEIQEPH